MSLTIRSGQMHIFERMRFIQQAHALCPAVEERHPEQCSRLGRPALLAMLTRTLEQAFDQGFRQPHHASIYADLAVRWGEDFGDRLPWAREVLTATRVPADLRASELLERSNAVLLDRYMGDYSEPEMADDTGDED
jgi:hypothetical protein